MPFGHLRADFIPPVLWQLRWWWIAENSAHL